MSKTDVEYIVVPLVVMMLSALCVVITLPFSELLAGLLNRLARRFDGSEEWKGDGTSTALPREADSEEEDSWPVG